ncbi:MAG: carbohydrate-binding protein [Chloroflexi bacterium]|nr:carbohydrate-binding protein [Chloroflexota bacterium]MBP8054435.1 carbohydrate-binding protein [Chloroflexota bacterium]
MSTQNHPHLSSRSQQDGQGFVEYGIMLLLLGIAVIVIVALLRPAIVDAFQRFVERAPVAPPSMGPIGASFTPRPSPTLAFANIALRTSEGAAAAQALLTLSYAFQDDISVTVSSEDITALAGDPGVGDYAAYNQTIVFAAGETAQVITVTLRADTVLEGDETFRLNLSNASVPNVGDPAVVTIVDDDTTPAFTVGQAYYSVNENAPSALSVIVQMDRAFSGNASVTFSLSGSATLGSDYNVSPAAGTLTFTPGQTSKTVTITPINEGASDGNKTILLNLSNPLSTPGGATLGSPNSANITLVDDETPPTLSFTVATKTVVESGPTVKLVVQLSQPFSSQMSMSYRTEGITAIPNQDYTPNDSTIVFPANVLTRTVEIPIIDDTTANEPPELFRVILDSVSPGTITIIPPSEVVVTINDNECAYGPYGVPGRVETENHLCNGEGVSYHDTTAGNQGTANFRITDADLRNNGAASNGVDLINTVSGEWLEYSINVSTNQLYDVQVRAAAPTGSNASFRLKVDDTVVGSTTSVPPTGSDTTYQDLYVRGVVLSQGEHILRLEIINGGASYDYLEIAQSVGPAINFNAATYSVNETGGNATITVDLAYLYGAAITVQYATSNGTATAGNDYTVASGPLNFPANTLSATFVVPILNDGVIDSPAETVNLTLSNPSPGQLGTQSTAVLSIIDDECSFGPYTVPVRVEAEYFHCGGEGVAYHDTTTGNAGTSSLRYWESVDLYTGGGSNGVHIGEARTGEWLTYQVNAAAAGIYNVTARVAANHANGSFTLLVDGASTYGPYTIPNTGSASTFQNVTVPGVYLTPGQHTIRINITVSTSNPVSLDYLEFSTATNSLLLTLGDSTNPINAPQEDIVFYSGGNYSTFFDGSDVGVTADLQGFQLMADGTILMTFDGTVASFPKYDIVRFTPTSLGSTTTGTFSSYFIGATYGLTSNSEDIDGFFLTATGTLLFSTTGNLTTTTNPSYSANDEDISAFNNGAFSMYMDSSDVGFSANDNNETIDAFWVTGTQIYFSTVGTFSVNNGLAGKGNDIGIFTISTPGGTTAGTYTSTRYFIGDNNSLTGENVDGFYVIP